MTEPEPIYVGTDMTPRWTGATVTSGSTGATSFANGATVTYALKTAAGAAVAGGTGTLTYITGSDGDYIGVIESAVTATLTPGAVYALEYTFVQGAYNAFRRVKHRAKYQGSE